VCRHCGAAATFAPGERATACAVCGEPFELLYVAARNPRPRQQPANDLGGNLFVPFALAMIGITVIAIVASIVAIFVNRAQADLARSRFAHRQTHIAPAIPPPDGPPRSLVWYEPEPALPVSLGPNRPGFLGLFAREQGRVGRVFLGAFEAAGGKQAWSAGPIGVTAEATLYLRLAASGDKVAVTDARPAVRVFAAATGEPLYALPLPSRASRACGGPDGKVYLELAGEVGRMLDLRSARAVPAPRPAWCPATPDVKQSPRCAAIAATTRLHAGCIEPDAAPVVESFESRTVMRQGELGLAVGRELPSGAAALVGFSPSSRALRWRAGIPGPAAARRSGLLVDLIGGQVLVKAESPNAPFHPHLLAFDAHTGALEWDTELAREEHALPPGLSAADGRVYVATEGQLQILDAHSGALVGTVGD